MCNSISHGFQNRLGMQCIGQRPADDLAAEPVDDGRQVHMTMVHLNIGNINGPDLIWERNHLVSQQIRNNCFLEVPLGEVWPGVNRADTHLLHTRTNQLATDFIALGAQLCRELPRSQKWHHGVPVVDSSHDILSALAGGFVFRRFVIDRRARHAQQLALAANRQLRTCPDQTPGWLVPFGESSLEESPAPA